MAIREDRIGAFPLLVLWALAAFAFTLRALLTADSTPLILDTDDAMRLTVVHDLLAGQGWFDAIQHRLNTPYGAPMHWSRLVDAPIALLLLVLRPVFGAAADTVAAYVWPLLLLGILLWLGARIALRLGGRAAVPMALLLPAFSLVTMAEFAPGRFDHHSLQILLALAMLWSVLASLDKPAAAVPAGIAAALSLSIGIEGLPVVAAVTAALGLVFIFEPRHAPALRQFGLSLATFTPLCFALTIAPAHWFAPTTDAISIVYVLAAVLGGATLVLLSVLPLPGWPLRLVVSALAASAISVLLLVLFPQILRGPYGMLDPWLIANWIDRISEAEPWIVSLQREPLYPLAVLVPCFTALAIIAWHIGRRPAMREAWLAYGVILLVATFVMLLQIRGARIALPLALPACAVLVGACWRRMVGSKGIPPILATIGAFTASASIFVAFLAAIGLALFPSYANTTIDHTRGPRQACLQPHAFAALAAMPPQRIMTPIDLGSHMLLYTPHSVVAAPYHRNQNGVLDTFRFFNAPIDEARDILTERGINLVVICPDMPELAGLGEDTSESFVALYRENRLPAWLVDETPAGSALRIYAVR